MSGIATQHADDGYSRRGNFGGSLVHSMIGITVCGSRFAEFEATGWLKSCS